MTEEQKIVIALDIAFFCLDCETIGNNPNECTKCMSSAVYPVSKFLNRIDRFDELMHLVIARDYDQFARQ